MAASSCKTFATQEESSRKKAKGKDTHTEEGPKSYVEELVAMLDPKPSKGDPLTAEEQVVANQRVVRLDLRTLSYWIKVGIADVDPNFAFITLPERLPGTATQKTTRYFQLKNAFFRGRRV